MKIKSYLCIALSVLALTACDDDFGTGDYQPGNPQGDIISFGNGSVTEQGVINFAELDDNLSQVQIAGITAPTSSDTTYTTTYQVKFADGTSYQVDDKGYMSRSELESYVNNLYGKRPVERDTKAVLVAYLGNGSTTTRITSDSFRIKTIAEAPEIAQNYYIIGGTLDWAASASSKEQKFTHSDKDVYDDPVFTAVFPANPDGDTWFAIGDDKACDGIANGDWSQIFGTTSGNGKNGESGRLDRRASLSDDGSFTVPKGAKFIKVVINMMDQTYEITSLNYSQYFYEIGNESKWATSHKLYDPTNNGIYQGYYYLNGEFKFKPNADNWDGDYELNGEGKIADNGGKNCPDPGAGFYQIDVNLQDGSYKLTPVTSVSAIGEFNNWKGDVDLTYNTADGAWEADNVALSGAVKFRMNHDWAVSWGGKGSGDNFDDLTQNNGANLNVDAGTYNIKLYLSYEGNNKLVLTKSSAAKSH